jgi:hypothetical protein
MQSTAPRIGVWRPRGCPNPAVGVPKFLDKTDDGGTLTGYRWRRSLSHPSIFQAAPGIGSAEFEIRGRCISIFF